MTTRTTLLGWTILCLCAAPTCLLAAEAPDKAPAAKAPEWTSWRGPAGDGSSPMVPEKLEAPKLLWKKPMAGDCFSPLAATADYVVVLDYEEEKSDFYRCFKAATGEEAWVYTRENPTEMDEGAGPRTMPLLHNGKAYCFNALGELYCFDLPTGKIVWKKDLHEEYVGDELPTWGYCSSPLLVDGKVIVHLGGIGACLVALDPDKGAVVWKGKGGGMNYANFLIATLGGVEQIVGYDAGSLGGWDVKTGKRLWEVEVDSSEGYLCPTPVKVGEKLLVVSHMEPARLFAFGKDGKIDPTPAGENEDLDCEMVTPTVLGELVLGVSGGLLCLDPAASIKTLWTNEDESCIDGVSHIVTGNGRALVFCDNGTAVLVEPTKTGCKVLGKAKLTGSTYVHPALAAGRLFARDGRYLYCYDLGSIGADTKDVKK